MSTNTKILTPSDLQTGSFAAGDHSLLGDQFATNGGNPQDVFSGTSGNDTLIGTSGDDFFNMSSAGNDTVSGLAGNDVFGFGSFLNAADKVDGGTGYDAVLINGDYSAGLTFAANTIVNIEELDCQGSTNSYKLTMNDGNVANDQTLIVNAANLDSTHTLTFDGSAETNGLFNVTSGSGNDVVKFGGNDNTLTAGSGNDTLTITGSSAGQDFISMGAGNDVMNFGALFGASDHIDGGTGTDTLNLNGDYSAGVSMNATTLTGVEDIVLAAGHSYKLQTADATVAAGQTMFVDGSTLASSQTLNFYGGGETDGAFHIEGGAGNDTIYGGSDSDTLNGNTGNDLLLAGGGSDFLNGGTGNDTVSMGASFSSGDTLNGGGGADVLILGGDYSAGLAVSGPMMQNFSTLTLSGDFSFNLTLSDANIAAGQTLTISDNFLTASDTITIDDSSETDGAVFAQFNDGEAANVHLGAGDDYIDLNTALLASDRFDGGGGISNHLQLFGGNTGHLDLDPAAIVNFSTISLEGQYNYDIKLDDAAIAAGQTVIIGDGFQTNAYNLIIDDSAESNGAAVYDLEGNAAKTITAGAGNDAFWVHGVLQSTDSLNGGGGANAVSFDGDYSSGLVLGPATLTNMSFFNFTGGDSYNITTDDATVAAGQNLSVQAGSLGNKDSLHFDGSAETDGTFSMSSGSGSDYLAGGAGNDTFSPGSGTDTVHGGGGDDTIVFGSPGMFSTDDTVDGGAGSDTVDITGDYSVGSILTPTTFTSVETISLSAGYSYDFITDDNNIAAGQSLTIYATLLGAGDSLIIDGSAETDGSFSIWGGAGNDALTGGAQADFFAPGLGTDAVNGGGGSDSIFFTSGFDATDTINGGSGKNNTLELQGDYSAGVVMGPTTIENIQTIQLDGGRSYNLTTDDNNVAAGQVLTVNGTSLSGADVMTFDGSAETDGAFDILGGTGTNVLSGGAGADTIDGANGHNTIYGNGGDDVITVLNDGSSVFGGDGEDSISGGGAETLDGGNGDDTLTAFGANSLVTGDAGNDLLSGVGGDTLQGGDDNDLLIAQTGHMNLDGGDGDDSFNIVSGSADTIAGGNGNDTINLGSTFDSTDQIDGGAGTDTVVLNGGSAVALAATTLVNVEDIQLTAGSSYSLTTDDGNVAAGQTLTIDGSALGAGDTLVVNGAAETNGTFLMLAGAGSNTLTGGTGADTFDLTKGTSDTATGNNGNDTFIVGGNLANVAIGGGNGSDVVQLAGSYATGLSVTGTMLNSVETVMLGAGFSYNLTFTDAVVGSGKNFTLDGSALGATDKLTFDGSQETDGHFNILAGTGNDVVTGGGQSDTFDLTHGGKDVVSGGAGDDTFSFGAALGAGDKIDGGAGNDTILLSGDYSAQLNFGAITITNVETIRLANGFSYNLNPTDAIVGAGHTMTIDGSHLGSAYTLTFHGEAETDGNYVMQGGAGNDAFTTGAGNDVVSGGGGNDIIDVSAGGNDTVTGGNGNDLIKFGAAFTAADSVNGGGSNQDTLQLDGNYSSGLTFGVNTVEGISIIKLIAGFSYALTSNDANVAAGGTMTVDGTSLGASDHLAFNGSAETDGHLRLYGGAGNDVLTGGAGIDQFRGGLGADTLTGGGGADIFIYKSASESTSTTYDHIVGLDFATDRFEMKKVKGIDTAVNSGSLSTANFDNDLAHVLDANHLKASSAVLFTVSAGTLLGHTFLVIDANGVAGYQAGLDYVIDVTGAAHMSSLAATDFV